MMGHVSRQWEWAGVPKEGSGIVWTVLEYDITNDFIRLCTLTRRLTILRLHTLQGLQLLYVSEPFAFAPNCLM